MEDLSDKIIVFNSYDTVMGANLVKTKLDAYGIPCFLTDENFVGLYPIRNELFPGVRLYVFEKDLNRVKEVLAEEQVEETESLQCPDCGSKDIVLKDHNQSYFEKILSTIFLSPFMEEKKSYQCNNCKRQFKDTNR